MSSPSRCKGVLRSCVNAGHASWAIVSLAFLLFKKPSLCIHFETMGGALKLEAMVKESLEAKRRYDKAGNGLLATVPNIRVKARSL